MVVTCGVRGRLLADSGMLLTEGRTPEDTDACLLRHLLQLAFSRALETEDTRLGLRSLQSPGTASTAKAA